MNIIAADDEPLALRGLVHAISEAVPQAKVSAFQRASEVLDFASQNKCDIAFLDIDLRETDGITLAKKLKSINPAANIIFVTAYSQYAMEAIAMRASGYILKPVTKELVLAEICSLRNPIRPDFGKAVRVHAFGNFEVYLNDAPMRFQYSKTKELLAYLIDRNGTLCDTSEIINVLWSDKISTTTLNSYFRNLRADLEKAFAEAGCGDAVTKQRGKLGINPQKIDCDYFNWLRGDPYAINSYRGEYMTQYSWAEMTLGRIEDSAR